MSMNEYTPDRWQIVRIVPKEGAPVFKVFGTWGGGYLWGSSWKLNSGIDSIVDKGDSYDVYGSSGSIYKLLKMREGMSGYGMQVLDALRAQIEASGGTLDEVSINETEKISKT